MLDTVLHSGTTHPELLWIVLPSLLTFAAGVGIALYADRVRGWLGSLSDEAAE